VARRHGLTPPQPFTWRREAQKRLETEAPSTFVPDAIVKDYVRSHRRRGREMFVPLHHPPGALDQAAPLAKWDLPPEFQTLRRLMEARMIEAAPRVCAGSVALETFDLDSVPQRSTGGSPDG
jgi:transposase-like protein